jgi:hypothetical protein
MKLLLLTLLTTVISFGLPIINKNGNSFEANLLDVVNKGGGIVEVKVKRKSDQRIFLIDLEDLSKECLVNLIVDLDKTNSDLIKEKEVKKQIAVNIAPKPPFKPPPPIQPSFPGTQIVEILSDVKRWDKKTVRINGLLDYRSSSSEQFSINQGGDVSIYVSYEDLPRRDKENILKIKNFSDKKVQVFGKLIMSSFYTNRLTLLARRVEF